MKSSRLLSRPAVRFAVALLALTLLGAVALRLPGMTTATVPFRDAWFTSVSALTVTGLSVLPIGTALTPVGQIVLMLLIQIGGIGYTALAIVALTALGRNISMTDRIALRDALGLASAAGILRLTKLIIATVLGIEAIGALMLAWHWRDLIPPEDLARFAAFHAVSAYCNAGFDLFTGNPDLPAGFPTDGASLWTKGILAMLGSIGMPVVFDLLTYPRRRRLSLHTRLTLRIVGFLYAFGTATTFLSEKVFGGVLADETPWRAAGLALAQSVFARTAGFAGLPDFPSLSEAGQIGIIGLMFIGGSPASMGGGITTGTFAVLALTVLGTIANREEPSFLGRRIGEATVRKAASILLVSVVVVVTNTWLLLITNDLPLNRAFFEIVSAFATCGLSLDVTGQLNGFGLAVVMFTMIWGRLGALTLLVALTSFNRTSRVRFPEEKVLIG